ncbi:MAG TPA: hypothetical protein PLQ36_03065 [Candidatus Gracilibacteria bacterium]|nr:hypothetical protein [Candidatus Gracilibacteria bacterium]
MITTYKTSISLDKEIKSKLIKYRNQSSVVNEALKLFFSREEFLKKQENAYWDKVADSIQNNDLEYVSLNPKNEVIDEKLLEEKLWK